MNEPKLNDSISVYLFVAFCNIILFNYAGSFPNNISWTESVLDSLPLKTKSISRGSNAHQRVYCIRRQRLLPLDHGGGPIYYNSIIISVYSGFVKCFTLTKPVIVNRTH